MKHVQDWSMWAILFGFLTGIQLPSQLHAKEPVASDKVLEIFQQPADKTQAATLLPIIALTADVFKEARESAAAAGVNAFIPKPVQLQELQNALNTHVKSATQEDEAALN